MIELATAAAAAAMLNNSVSAIDKVYNWWRTKQGQAPASQGLRSDPQKQVLQYVSLTGVAQPIRVVMSYTEFATRLTPDDVSFIRAFETRMRRAMTQWEALNADLPLASPVERVRIEGNMENLKDRDICPSLKQIVDFIQKLGIDLQDHYASVRSICPA
jgi:hypothetical protein